MLYRKKDDGILFFHKGRIQPGKVVGEEVAALAPALFEPYDPPEPVPVDPEEVDAGWEDEAFPIEDYDSLNVSEVVEALQDLYAEDVEVVRAYEAAHKGRKTVLRECDELLEG